MYYFKSIKHAEKVFDRMKDLSQTNEVIYVITQGVGESSKAIQDFKILLARFKVMQKGNILNIVGESGEIESTLIFRTKKGAKENRWITDDNSLKLYAE